MLSNRIAVEGKLVAHPVGSATVQVREHISLRYTTCVGSRAIGTRDAQEISPEELFRENRTSSNKIDAPLEACYDSTENACPVRYSVYRLGKEERVPPSL